MISPVRLRVAAREGLVAGGVGGLIGVLPSTLHAVVSRRSPLEAALAAGSMLLPQERRRGPLLVAAFLTHGAISLGWGVVLSLGMPRRRPLIEGSLAGLAIAALDLGVVGRGFPRVRRLPVGPQLADHAVYGAAVGLTLSWASGAHGRRLRGW